MSTARKLYPVSHRDSSRNGQLNFCGYVNKMLVTVKIHTLASMRHVICHGCVFSPVQSCTNSYSNIENIRVETFILCTFQICWILYLCLYFFGQIYSNRGICNGKQYFFNNFNLYGHNLHAYSREGIYTSDRMCYTLFLSLS